ncbi:Ku protein [Streptomyces sp. NRRL S-87]|uniref:non-homologous end joining protein Ku n=1 Tax=Streptomyces sp. NRRL S-87 TaxID=1463920 RepID=UPI0004C2A538|nr:Ku protein [Streptomyces sp. NRRL S-87]
MRSIWNGAISFGLVSIPIKLVNATESHSISFRQIHVADGGRVRYRKVCELDGEELAADEIGKGYEEVDGSIIPITDDDLAGLPLPTAKTIEIVSFVPAEEIDPLQMDAAYYLAANGAAAAKPYTLLREALKRSRRVAIAKFALRGRERLGMLRVVDDVIAMHGLLWPDEIRAPEGVAPETNVTVREAELDLADALMATLGEVDLNSMHDDYRTAVEELIAAKSSGERLEPVAAEPRGQVIDLMAALEKSVQAARVSRGEAAPEAAAEEGGGEGGPAEVTPIRRAAGGGRGATAAAPKAVGGKKSTSTAARAKRAAPKKDTTAKKTAAARGGAAAKSTAAKSTATGSATGKSTTAAKSAAAKKASKSAAGAKTARTAAAAGTKKAASSKTAAPRKRTSA